MNNMFFLSFCQKKNERKSVLCVFLSKKRMKNNLFFMSFCLKMETCLSVWRDSVAILTLSLERSS